MVEVLVETKISKNDLVELKLTCGHSGTRLCIDRTNENTEGPSDNDESEARNQELQSSEQNSIDFICRHDRNSFGVTPTNFSSLQPYKACVKALLPSADSVEAIIGTPVSAAARAVVRTPCPSRSHKPITPTGHKKSGVGSLMLKS